MTPMTTIDQIINSGKFFFIAGPCAIESKDLCFEVAERLTALSTQFDVPVIFKSSYAKANRLSGESFSGHGISFGLEVLAAVKTKFHLPILTDVHETSEIAEVSRVADILQIPAFLCRQTELVRTAAATGKWINIKKGQFVAPEDMDKIAAKAGTKKVMLTERGSSFGYHNLVVDFRSFVMMKKYGYPVIYDVTHSLQLPGGGGHNSSGQPQFVIPMARAAAAIGIDGIFVETHPEPSKALCDAASMIRLDLMEDLIAQVLAIHGSRRED